MTRAKRKNEPISSPPSPPARQGVYYRCPACGEEVDGTDRGAVARHHIHVLHPHLFRQGGQ